MKILLIENKFSVQETYLKLRTSRNTITNSENLLMMKVSVCLISTIKLRTSRNTITNSENLLSSSSLALRGRN